VVGGERTKQLFIINVGWWGWAAPLRLRSKRSRVHAPVYGHPAPGPLAQRNVSLLIIRCGTLCFGGILDCASRDL
jgi:hypothetical protein